MKMIAIGTVHGRKLIKAADPKNPKSKAKYEDILVKPGEEFDTDDFGIDQDEANRMVARKTAKRKTREIPDDGDTVTEPLQSLSDAELIARADELKLAIAPGATREDVITAINKATK